MKNQQQVNAEKDPKRTVYKEKEGREENIDNGQSSSVADIGRTGLVSRPERKNKPLGSSHEPGTTPGADI